MDCGSVSRRKWPCWHFEGLLTFRTVVNNSGPRISELIGVHHPTLSHWTHKHTIDGKLSFDKEKNQKADAVGSRA